jgi:hypothetical protein
MADLPPPWADDAVARKTRWDPLVGGGANFRTRNLVRVNPARMEFPASLGMRLFAGVFLLAGIAVGVVGGVNREWFPLAFGAAFAAVGGGLLFFGTTPVVFDKREGAFWKGRTAPNEAVNRLTLKRYAALADLHALQIIKERVRGDDRSYDSFELNLVLTDGRRINVTDHGDYETLRRNAETLSEFLERPLWDTAGQGVPAAD